MTSTRVATGDDPVIASKADLVAVFARGEKPAADWRVGTEHEKLVFRQRDHRQPAWDENGGIRDLLQGFGAHGWAPVLEDGRIIGASGADGALSLEPAGQFELSGAPRATVHETRAELERHRAQCLAIGAELGLGFLGLGFNPVATRAELPWMPKGRYRIMHRYMPLVGSLGLDMMLRTCTVQVNLDYGSEADMVRKMRVALALQPLATALFANSPFTEGRANGYLSYRSHIWTDTDADRTGMLPFVFDDGFGYERYADYMLDVPMYFALRDGHYVDLAGQSFRRFVDSGLPALPGVRPTIGDWTDHLSTTFPEVRLKSFLEMRGADVGSLPMCVALAAFWVGLLYDGTALDAAAELVRGWPVAAMQQLRTDVPTRALAALAPDGRPLAAVAREVLAIARAGLDRRARLDDDGHTEAIHLAPLEDIAARGQTMAEHWLQRFHGPWQQDVRPVWAEAQFFSEG